MEDQRIEQLLECGLQAAAAGSEVLMSHLSDHNESLVIRAKRDGSLVSAVDIESHRAIQAILTNENIPIISEEGELPAYSERMKWSWFWLVDPLDGTESYLKSRAGFAVNIALCNADGPVLGVIADPLNQRVFGGSLFTRPFVSELQALHNRQHIVPREVQRPFRLVTSWNETMSPKELLPPRFNPADFDVAPVSGALKFCQIATGEADVHARSAEYMEWDCAAGDGILRSMGIAVLGRDTHRPIHYNTMSLRVGNFYATRI